MGCDWVGVATWRRVVLGVRLRFVMGGVVSAAVVGLGWSRAGV